MSRKTTILEELTRQNLDTANRVTDGSNTFGDWPEIGAWVPWEDFTAEKLYLMFRDVVESEWTIRSNLSAAPTSWAGEFYDEDELEHSIITPHILPPVNAALRHGLRYTKLDNSGYDLDIGRGGRTYYEPGGDRRYKPDWSLCSPHAMQEVANRGFRYTNLLPGDTKVGNKWQSSHVDRKFPNKDNATRPVRQLLNYCEVIPCRYGFIISEAELLVMRIRGQPTGTGRAASRPPRPQRAAAAAAAALQGHSRGMSMSTDASWLSASTRDVSMYSASSYHPTGPATDGYTVEYRAVPAENHGKGRRQLTIQLALFYLAWIAGVGDHAPMLDYPSLDSFWPLRNGAFRHNTMGLMSKEPKKLEYPNPSGERGPRWVNVGGEAVEVLTLESALTLEITEHTGRLFYYYSDNNEPVLVADSLPVYDEESGEYGYFDGLTWKVGIAARSQANET